MSKIIVRTEVWNTKVGTVAKAVVRDERGTFIGATNQTEALVPSINLVGSK
jgi:hypothetical protein